MIAIPFRTSPPLISHIKRTCIGETYDERVSTNQERANFRSGKIENRARTGQMGVLLGIDATEYPSRPEINKALLFSEVIFEFGC